MHSVRAYKHLAVHPNSVTIPRTNSSSLLLNCFLKCVLTSLFSTALTFGQNIQHGTVVNVAFLHDHIVAAVDSKVLNLPNPISCKMVELGKYGFFVINGMSGVPAEFFGPDIAKEVFSKVGANPISGG